MPCTTLLVGKNASYDGSTMTARNEDSGSGHFNSKKFITVLAKDQPRHYKSVISHVEIELPDDPMRYTAMPNATDEEGIWGAAGVNEANVSMTATETLTSNERVLGADPMVRYEAASEGREEKKGGIGEEDMVTLTLPYIRSAREGVERLGSLLEQYGTYEINGIAFQDVDEIWWLETIGGHHWIARRVPDDAYVVMPNQLGLDCFDLNDAMGEAVEYMCSKDLKEFIENNHLADISTGIFDPRLVFGSHTDSDHCYNTPRAWYMERFFNPTSVKWDGPDAEYGPESDNIPWMMIPEHKITVEDAKYVLSSYYQGTDFNPYKNHGDLSCRGAYRPIGINRNNFLSLVQIRPYMPETTRSIEWVAFASNAFNSFVPFYANVDTTPEYVANTGKTATTDSFYWAMRYLGALADADFDKSIAHIERYQMAVASKGYEIIGRYDKEIAGKDAKNASELMEQANEEIAAMLKEKTYDVLDKVLFERTSKMKNAFSRSDN